MTARNKLTKAKRWVIKVGSALITNDGKGLDYPLIEDWVNQIVRLIKSGNEVVLVSSGAVAAGMQRLGMSERPSALYQLQAAAAVGQMGLVQTYESLFQKHSFHTAQILLTHDDLSDRQRYLNARSVLWELIEQQVIPVVNENDTVSNDEIQFGDNDTLAALVANLIEADALVILTDQQGLFDKDPRKHPDAQMMSEVLAEDNSLDAMASGGAGTLGRGGMTTKIRAARLAARSGALTVIAYGRNPKVLAQLSSGEEIGTLLKPSKAPLAAKKQWLASHLKAAGTLSLDDGAIKHVCSKGASLLPIGVTACRGNFSRGELVICTDKSGHEVARGLVNYSSVETNKILGKATSEIESLLGYVDESSLIHRDNLVVTSF